MPQKVYRILLGLFCLFSRYTSSLTYGLEGYFFTKVSFHYLEGIVIQTSAVYDDFQCLLSCKRSPECLLLNIADQPNKDGLYECVLLRNQTSESTGLTPSHLYHHFSRLECKSPLGMKSGAIPDTSITASTSWSSTHAPPRARLDTKVEGNKTGAWSALYNDINQWLQVDLGTVTTVTHIATQGRYGPYEQWVTSYALQYSLDGEFFDYEAGKIFSGNSDRNTVVKHALDPVVTARYIGVRPKTWHRHISMRMELYGCRLN